MQSTPPQVYYKSDQYGWPGAIDYNPVNYASKFEIMEI